MQPQPIDEVDSASAEVQGMGVKYMKSWERDRELVRDAEKRADEALKLSEEMKSQLDAAREEIARLKNNQ